MDQSSSSSSKKMSETSSSSSSSSKFFFAKMFSCFHVKASTTEAAAAAASSSSVPSSAHQHHDQPRQQEEEEKLVIYVGGVGVDKESMVRYSVPWTYVSYPQFKKLLLEKSSSSSLSGEELKKIRSKEGGSVVIHCEVAEFEYARKLVKSQEKEKRCREQSYDERLWAGYWKKMEKEKSTPEIMMEKEKSSTPEIINKTSSSSSINGIMVM